MTTEELKRVMYTSLTGFIKAFTIGNFTPPQFAELENSFEAYLEAIRQERAVITEERDQLRNRLQAFEFANKSAGQFLQAAQAKVKAQRQSIGQLKNERNNARSLAAVNYDKYQNARRELSELRKLTSST